MILTPQGRKFVITGTLPGHTRASAQQALRELGASIQKSVSSKTEFLIAGSGAGSKIDKARSLGVTVLDSDQFLALLEHGECEIVGEDEVEEAEAIPLGDAIGELRGALDGAPNSERWSRIVYALERCDPQLMEVAVEYVEGYLGGWDGQAMEQWEPFSHRRREQMDPFELEVLEAMSAGWTRGLPKDELRVAPPHWNHELIQDVDSPKHRVIRALNFEYMRVNGTQLSKLFVREHLLNLRLLNIGHQNKTSKTFFRKLREAENMRSLEELWLYRLKDKEIAGLEGESKLENLRKLRFQDSWHSDDEAWPRLFGSEAVANVETIAIHWGVPHGLMPALRDGLRMPSWHHVELYTYESSLTELLGTGICDRVDKLSLFGPCATAGLLNALFGHREFEKIKEVDLSKLERGHNSDAVSKVVKDALTRHQDAVSGLERLVLGSHRGRSKYRALTDEGVEVV